MTPMRGEAEARDWAELPQDAIATILGKLGQAEILTGAAQVCATWRHTAADEPVLWCRVEARSQAGLAVARLALRRSAGRCEEFVAEGAGDDGFLLDLAELAPSLKCLRLISCSNVSNKGFAEAIKKLPMVEDLELSLCENVFGQEALKTVGKACPQLKRFRLNKSSFWTGDRTECNDNGEAMGIATMTELRSLQIFGNSLTNIGLATILDSCYHLNSLDICNCFVINMDDSLQAKCARLNVLRLPLDPIEDYEFEVIDYSDYYDYDYSDYCDYDYSDYYDYCSGYEDELDEES